MRMPLDNVAIIILNWNQYKDTKECIDSLKKVDFPNFDIYIVDNGSKDGSIDRLKQEYKNVDFAVNPMNLGFAQACNVGIQLAKEKKDYEYYLLLNNDTTVEPDFLSILVDEAKKKNNCLVASPKIMFYSNPKKIWFLGGFYSIIGKPYHKYYGQVEPPDISSAFEADWVSGCSMLIKKEAIDTIGFLDPDYFNNFEDVDYCLRLRKRGFKIIVVPQSKIYHKFAASMGGKYSPFYTYYRARNILLFLFKSKQWAALILNFIIFPIYSIVESIRNRQPKSIFITIKAVYDFMTGKRGRGVA